MKFNDREIESLHRRGYLVEKLTPYQFRVECVIDLYPRRRRFHNIATQSRGEYPYRFCGPVDELLAFVDQQVKAADEVLDRLIASGHVAVTEQAYAPGERRRWLNEHNPGWWTKFTKTAGA